MSNICMIVIFTLTILLTLDSKLYVFEMVTFISAEK